jgi:predicted dehydrogenase
MSRTHWGIIGCGKIAESFAQGLALLPEADLVAVAARDGERAAAFAQRHGVARAYGSYRELAEDAGVAVVYVATTTAHHAEVVELCLSAGRHVLCEKPLTTNAKDSRRLIACARRHDRFLMEAMWTRCLPVYREVRRWLADGRIGDPRSMRGDFSVPGSPATNPRHFQRDLGGGALLDLGIYPLAMAQWLFGSIIETVSDLHLAATHVDDSGVVITSHADGRKACSCFSMVAEGAHDLIITGTEGSIRVPGAWWAQEATLVRGYQSIETAKPEWIGSGYAYEAMEVMACLGEGKRESDLVPLADSLELARVIDQVLEHAGIAYSGS